MLAAYCSRTFIHWLCETKSAQRAGRQVQPPGDLAQRLCVVFLRSCKHTCDAACARATYRLLRWDAEVALDVVVAVVVHFLSRTHPFLLADNCHYIFHIWRKFMLRYRLAKYLPVPSYAASRTSLARRSAPSWQCLLILSKQ
jgi:hypothetical protein